MNKMALLALIAVLPASALAQSVSSDGSADAQASSRWRIGMGIAAFDNAYVGQGTKVMPFPLLNYEGERFFFRGVTGGVHLWSGGGLAVDAIVTTGFNNINADDFSRSGLARRGIDRDDLEDRDRSIDAGLAATWGGKAGYLRMEAKSDVSGTSKGQEYSLEYGYPMRWRRFSVTPTVGATYLSSKVANYYYGIHNAEIQHGVASYQPGAAWVPETGISVTHPIGAKWVWMIRAKYSALPSKLSNSPLVDGSYGSSLFLGFSRAL
jgi:Outer membrane protein V